MISLEDSRWAQLKGRYKVPYDASVPLHRLERGEDVWDELWENLHHQGDVGEASYAAVPHLVRILGGEGAPRSWQIYSLVSIIEVERNRKANPPLPDWLRASYSDAISALGGLALADLRDTSDQLLIQSALGFVALSKGLLKLGALIATLDDSELDEILENYDAWSQLYR